VGGVVGSAGGIWPAGGGFGPLWPDGRTGAGFAVLQGHATQMVKGARQSPFGFISTFTS
jgi:hypothetical protein